MVWIIRQFRPDILSPALPPNRAGTAITVLQHYWRWKLQSYRRSQPISRTIIHFKNLATQKDFLEYLATGYRAAKTGCESTVG